MWELGVDISGQESKALERYLGEPFEYVVTVCDDANEACPIFPGAKERLQWSFEDPSRAEEEWGTARNVPAGKRRDPGPCRETSERESVNLRVTLREQAAPAARLQ
jgi:arsenate reductase